MPDDVKLDDKALAKANEAAGKAWPPTYSHASHIEAAIRAYLGALPSLPSDIDGLVEELERGLEGVTPGPWKVGDREPYVEVWGGMRMNASPIIASLECEPRSANATHIARCSPNNIRKLIAALRARQAPEGVVEEAAKRANFAFNEAFPGSRMARETAIKVARAALSAVPSGAKVTECATEGCSHQATVHFIRGGVGSYYCNECYLRVQALTGQPS